MKHLCIILLFGLSLFGCKPQQLPDYDDKFKDCLTTKTWCSGPIDNPTSTYRFEVSLNSDNKNSGIVHVESIYGGYKFNWSYIGDNNIKLYSRGQYGQTEKTIELSHCDSLKIGNIFYIKKTTTD